MLHILVFHGRELARGTYADCLAAYIRHGRPSAARILIAS